MSGSSIGKNITVTTFGESHGVALGVIVDGIPSGLTLSENDIQPFMDRRKPGQNRFTTARAEADEVEILSGVFEGKTTGTPIAVMVRNKDQHSKDYGDIATTYRPGHADYTFMEKYGIRDYRGGGRSSGRETLSRVAAGAICSKILKKLGVTITTYTKSIGPVQMESFDADHILEDPLFMPDAQASEKAQKFLDDCRNKLDSAGGVIECRISGVKAGLGDPVFNKIDAALAQAMLSIGAVKGFEIGDGFAAATSVGSVNNDPFTIDEDGNVTKVTNHSGGVLGGMTDGSDIIFRVAVKPTPSIGQLQKTVNESNEEVDMTITGRHDPVVVPRAVVVVESMAAIVLADAYMSHMTDRMEYLKEFYS